MQQQQQHRQSIDQPDFDVDVDMGTAPRAPAGSVAESSVDPSVAGGARARGRRSAVPVSKETELSDQQMRKQLVETDDTWTGV